MNKTDGTFYYGWEFPTHKLWKEKKIGHITMMKNE